VRSWRWLRDGPAPGAWNMGVDEALLAALGRGAPPTLRCYAWQRPTVSLGWAQELGADRRQACAARGVDVVRRTTGGGAVLHGSDLGYSVAAPAELLPSDLVECYALLARGVVAGLRALGVEARCVLREGRAARHGFDCFASAGAGEIVAGGAKLCGSAQRRTRRAVLQHGSLRLRADPGFVREAAGIDAGSATSLAELGCGASFGAVAEAVARGLGEVLGASLEPGELDPLERSAAAKRPAEPARGALLPPQGPL
jgi:lipoate-protein ligase A